MAVGLSTVSSDPARIKSLIRQRYIPQAYAAPAPAPAPATAMATAPPTPPPTRPQAPGYDPYVGGHSGENYGGGFFGTINSILRGGGGAGFYSPGPNQGILDAVREMALRDAQASRDHAALVAQNLGVDPASAAANYMRADTEAQGGVARALSDASYGELTHQRDFIQQLLLAMLGKQGQQNVYNPTKGTDVVNSISGLVSASKPSSKYY